MSVKRSPPGKSLPLSVPQPLQYGSDSALNITSTEPHTNLDNFVTKRQKRTFTEDISDHSQTTFSELKSLFMDLKSQQELKFNELRDSMKSIMSQNIEIETSVKHMSDQYDDLLKKVVTLEHENISYKKHIKLLESKLDILEKNSRNTTIEIRNIPIQPHDNRPSILKMVKDIGNSLNLESEIQDLEVKDIYRKKSNAIVVDFTTTSRKESVIGSFRQFNKQKRENNLPQLNTQHINLPLPAKPIYISEYLTTKARKIFYLARENVKNKKIVAAWTSFGKVYIKKEENQPPIRIDEEQEFLKLTA